MPPDGLEGTLLTIYRAPEHDCTTSLILKVLRYGLTIVVT